jgi:hypothetical protein
VQNGELTLEQRERLIANTTLPPDQQAALDNGTLTLPPEQMTYLQGFSRAFGDKTPAEIKAIMAKARTLTSGERARNAGFCRRVGAQTRTVAECGATWGNRTPDLFITSESLCRLS